VRPLRALESPDSQYNMSENIAPSKPEPRKISKAEINELPLINWQGRIEILNTIGEMDAAVEKLKHEAVLGFAITTLPHSSNSALLTASIYFASASLKASPHCYRS